MRVVAAMQLAQFSSGSQRQRVSAGHTFLAAGELPPQHIWFFLNRGNKILQIQSEQIYLQLAADLLSTCKRTILFKQVLKCLIFSSGMFSLEKILCYKSVSGTNLWIWTSEVVISLTSALSVLLPFTFLFKLVTQGKLNCIKNILPCHFISPNPTEQRGDFPLIPRHGSQFLPRHLPSIVDGRPVLHFSHAPCSEQLFQKGSVVFVTH